MVPKKTNTNLSVSGTIVHRMKKSSQNKMRSAGPTIVVLGAGINGAALARQFVLNNAHVILADTRDIAGGTTAWSTRLIHGGLRYLEYGEFDLVRESLAERNRLVKIASHLVKPLRFAIPLRQRRGGMLAAAARIFGWESMAKRLASTQGRGSWAVGIGLTLYDFFSRDPDWPAHAMHRSCSSGMPGVDKKRFPWIATYFDAQCMYPERLTVELLVDAEKKASQRDQIFQLVTHHEWEIDADGGITFTRKRDHGLEKHPAADSFTVRPDVIVNATGAWVDQTLSGLRSVIRPVDNRGDTSRQFVRGTKGSHVIFEDACLRESLGEDGVYAEAPDGRPIFILPFAGQQVLVGTTDILIQGDPSLARTDQSEVDYLMKAVREIMPQCQLSENSIVQHYCGVRPLPGPCVSDHSGGTPGSVTRRHLLLRHEDAVIPTWSIVGGKLTTCRSLGEESVKKIFAELEVPVVDTARQRVLPGCLEESGRKECLRQTRAFAMKTGVPAASIDSVVQWTVGLFGARAPAVFETMKQCPQATELPPLIGDSGLPTAAAVFVIEKEWAESLGDLIERRLMMIFSPRLSLATLQDLADVLVAMGRLHRSDRESAISAEVKHLEEDYGKGIISR
jgi:glycerol-3-phosphate dehydrogenase